MMNMERQPLSGKIIEFLQQKYIQQRIASGTGRQYSDSEPILVHLRTKGLIRGMPSALSESQRQSAALEPNLQGIGLYTHALLRLLVGGAEFTLTIVRKSPYGLREDGHWKHVAE